MKFHMCRICLVENVAMFSIANTPLQEIYEQLTAKQLDTNTSRPFLVCYVCFARLRNCYHLRNSCLRSEKMLSQILISNDQVSPSKSQAVPKFNFLTVTPTTKMSILCDVVHEWEEGGTAKEKQIKIELESTLTEEIDIKMEPVDASDAEEYDMTEMQHTDEKINMAAGQYNSIIDDSATALTPKLTTFSSEHNLNKLIKTELADTMNNEDVCNTNKIIVTVPVIFEDKIFDKLDNTTKGQEYSATAFGANQQSIVSSNANIEPSHRDLSTKTDLETHLHVSNTEKPYKCDICNRQFKHKQSLVRHVGLHTGKKLYKCDICDKQFNQRNTLERHSVTHTGNKPHKCDICFKQFTQKSHLVRHFVIHSGEKNYKCHICNKQFNQKPDLVRHFRIHTGEKLYKCDICGKQFQRKAHVVEHSLTHTGEKRYKCHICNKRLTTKRYLNVHIRNHMMRK